MNPIFTKNDSRNSRLANVKFVCDGLLADFASSVQLFDFSDVCRCQNSIVMRFATDAIGCTWCDVPSFAHHISNVVGVSANKQVVWSNARRVVTVMADDHSLGYAAKMQFPTQAVGADVPAVSEDFAVATSTDMFIIPAGSGLSDGSPEAIFKWTSMSSLSHSRSLTANRSRSTA